jgi:hypothetical protein
MATATAMAMAMVKMEKMMRPDRCTVRGNLLFENCEQTDVKFFESIHDLVAGYNLR